MTIMMGQRSIGVSHKKILILDHSVSRIEAPAIKHWLPTDAEVLSLFIDTEESFPDDLINRDFTHVVHSGSELSITATSPFTEKAVTYMQNLRDRGVPQFGICYGHQLVCLALAGNHAVRSSPNGLEAGWRNVTFNNHATKILGVRHSEVVWQHHFDEVIELPAGSELLATNAHAKIQAYINYEQRLFGTQFHPEFDQEIGNRFLLEDRQVLARNGYNVDEIITGGPSIDAGRMFFDFFLHQAAQPSV